MTNGGGPKPDATCRGSDRILSLAGTPGTKWLRPHVEFFVSALLLHLAAREGVRYFQDGESWRLAGAAIIGSCFVASFSPPLRLTAASVVLAVLTYKFFNRFPTNANHFFIEFLAVAFIVLGYRPQADEASLRAVSQSMRWLLVIFLFWSGVRKLCYGTYFEGAFFAHTITSEPRAQFFFQFILSPEEYQRVVNSPIPGPYHFKSALPLILSNLVYLSEIGIPVLLLTKRFRMLGFWLAFGSIIAIEAYAREMMFGAMFTLLLLFFTEGRVASRLLPVFIAVYALLLASAANVLPHFQFN